MEDIAKICIKAEQNTTKREWCACFLDLLIHYDDVKWARYRLKSPASRLFTQPFIRAQIKVNINVPRHWPMCGEFTGDRWIPRTKGQ